VSPSLTRRLAGGITIRRAESIADYRACQDAQRLAWGIAEAGYVVPIATLVGANLHGGLVLGAFRDEGSAVGLSFGFLGRVDDRLCLYSQLTGVVPGWQARGLGYELKQVQRDFARAESLPLIAWAFDPLQAGNARFNLVRLGACVRRYVDNMYGPRTDALNAGVPTDRVIAEWDVRGEPSAGPIEGLVLLDGVPRLIWAAETSGGIRIPEDVNENPTADQVLVEIPERIAELRRDHPDAAEAWRVAVGRALKGAFAAGYLAVSLVSEQVGVGRRSSYLLQRGRNSGKRAAPDVQSDA
jgi:predicted GNAT superfamily acetyltransferase